MKLLQLNVEKDAHTHLVRSFIASEKADVVCLQEVYKSDITYLTGMQHYVFLPMVIYSKKDGTFDESGIAICSHTPFTRTWQHYYFKPYDTIRELDRTNQETKRATIQHGVVFAELESGVTVATVHHTWTQDGDKPSEHQKKDTAALMDYLVTQPDHILCGDFNIPRGYNSCYETLTEHLEDCVPREYISSMHVPLHRLRVNPLVSAELEKYMVDYIFRTKNGPTVSNVEMHCGMSDHCALTADIV
jgi:endonuclease/exonuclease/phosphatase family metal-dependent hydrolase